jgi:Tol biopolymer transport system component
MSRHLNSWAFAAVTALVGGAVVSAGVPLGQPALAAARPTVRHGSSAATLTTPRDGRIVYHDTDTGRIMTVNPDGTAVQAVSPAGDDSGGPAWSSDGSRIVYSSSHPGGDPRIFSVRPDGSDLRAVVTDKPGFSDFVPRYTPDGAHIIFTRCRPDPPGGCALYVVRSDGTRRHALTAYDDRGGFDFQSDVSPDGRRVAFVRYFYRGVQARIWVMRINGTHQHPITRPRLEAGLPRWTPDGRHLLVTSNIVHLGDNVYRIRDDGSNVTRLTSARFPHNEQWADPSPSGSRIVFSDDRAYPGVFGFDLAVMRRDGSHPRSITHQDRLIEPDWGTAPLQAPASTTPAAPRTAHPGRPAASPLFRGWPPTWGRSPGELAPHKAW